ncbi:hypothetical protein Hanom_Chr13g01191831 [Helianthus anomalus]
MAGFHLRHVITRNLPNKPINQPRYHVYRAPINTGALFHSKPNSPPPRVTSVRNEGIAGAPFTSRNQHLQPPPPPELLPKPRRSRRRRRSFRYRVFR